MRDIAGRAPNTADDSAVELPQVCMSRWVTPVSEAILDFTYTPPHSGARAVRSDYSITAAGFPDAISVCNSQTCKWRNNAEMLVDRTRRTSWHVGRKPAHTGAFTTCVEPVVDTQVVDTAVNDWRKRFTSGLKQVEIFGAAGTDQHFVREIDGPTVNKADMLWLWRANHSRSRSRQGPAPRVRSS